jgi:hypothetical protein
MLASRIGRNGFARKRASGATASTPGLHATRDDDDCELGPQFTGDLGEGEAVDLAWHFDISDERADVLSFAQGREA